jgi:hypothetical protein
VRERRSLHRFPLWGVRESDSPSGDPRCRCHPEHLRADRIQDIHVHRHTDPLSYSAKGDRPVLLTLNDPERRHVHQKAPNRPVARRRDCGCEVSTLQGRGQVFSEIQVRRSTAYSKKRISRNGKLRGHSRTLPTSTLWYFSKAGGNRVPRGYKSDPR